MQNNANGEMDVANRFNISAFCDEEGVWRYIRKQRRSLSQIMSGTRSPELQTREWVFSVFNLDFHSRN